MDEYLVENQSIGSAEVMQMILGNLDVARLKICRLVCRSWNVQACSVLQKRSAALSIGSTATKDTADTSDTSAFALNRTLMNFGEVTETGKQLRLPSPFRDLGISLRRQEFHPAWKYVSENQPTVLKLGVIDGQQNEVEVDEAKESARAAFTQLLNYCSGTVQLITFEVSVDFSMHTSLPFPNLKEIHLPSRYDSLSYSGALYVILINSSPNLVKIICPLKQKNVAVLQLADLRIVKELELNNVVRNDAFNPFQGLDMPVLESLTIKFREDPGLDNGGSACTAPLLRLIVKFSSQIRKLVIDCGNSDISDQFDLDEFPICPLLTELFVDIGEFRIGNSLMEKLPALKSLSVTTIYLEDVEQDIVQFRGLEKLDFLYVEDDHLEWEPILHIASHVCRRFPNAITWHVNSWFVTVLSSIADACADGEEIFFNFSTIKTLQFQSLDEFDYGRSNNDEKARAFAESMIGLRHLKALKHLEINDWCRRDYNFGLIDLENAPTLESFTFPWNILLDFDVMVDKLKNLRTVTVSNCCDFRHGRTMEKLFAALPNARCGCRRV